MNFTQQLWAMYTKYKTLLITLLEWALITAWALWIGRAYLDFNPRVWPSGSEYIMSIQNNYNWQLLSKCGACFFWNGYTNGGAPAFIDLHGSWLHPISIISTSLLGVFNGGKLAFVLSLLMAGLAQWWLGKVLKISFLPRLSGALLVVAGGHLSGRMDSGSIPFVISTAACSLVIPPALYLALNGGKKYAIILGISLGLAAISGQGYLQAGLVASLIPALGYLIIEFTSTGIRFKPIWKDFLLAGILALLIAAILIIPVLHNLPNLNKEVDPQFLSAQPLKYSILNLVIDDVDFMRDSLLGKMTSPSLYINYIGWIPLGLALIALLLTWREHHKIFISFGLALSVIYLASSADLLKPIVALPFGGFAAGLRNPEVIQGLAIPFIVAISSLGFERLLKLTWPTMTITLKQTDQTAGQLVVALKWFVLIIPMLLALKSLSDFSKLWVRVVLDDGPSRVKIMQEMKTPDTQWVQPVPGESFWLPAAMENNLKIRSYFRLWSFQGPELPKAYMEFTRTLEDANLPGFQKIVDGMVLFVNPESPYAYITTNEKLQAPCKATAMGGNVDVTCDSSTGGELVVLERASNDWNVSMDGKKAQLDDNPWLATPIPAGKHTFSFRFRPWDVPLGIILSSLGWLASITGLIFYSRQRYL